MTNADHIATLVPEDQEKFRDFIARGDHYLSQHPVFNKYHLQITESRRTLEYQAGLFSIGRKWNEQKRIWEQVSRVVTHTMNSKHLTGQAIDVCLSDGKSAIWPDGNTQDGKRLWLELGQIAKQCGLFAGALWTKTTPDYDHYSSVLE